VGEGEGLTLVLRAVVAGGAIHALVHQLLQMSEKVVIAASSRAQSQQSRRHSKSDAIYERQSRADGQAHATTHRQRKEPERAKAVVCLHLRCLCQKVDTKLKRSQFSYHNDVAERGKVLQKKKKESAKRRERVA
jgi:hypothetical protein